MVLNGEQVIGNPRRPRRHLGATNRLHDLPACRIAFTRRVRRTPSNLQNLSGRLVLTPGREALAFSRMGEHRRATSSCGFARSPNVLALARSGTQRGCLIYSTLLQVRFGSCGPFCWATGSGPVQWPHGVGPEAWRLLVRSQRLIM